MDYCPPGFSVHGILQTRIPEWVDMPYSRGASRPRDWTGVSSISCSGMQVLEHLCNVGTPSIWICNTKAYLTKSFAAIGYQNKRPAHGRPKCELGHSKTKAGRKVSSESVSRSVVFDSAIPCTVARKAPLSMGFFRQEYWSGLPFLYPGNFLDPEIEPRSLRGI